jgi:hypothetical protein
MYDSFLKTSGALDLDLFEQPLKIEVTRILSKTSLAEKKKQDSKIDSQISGNASLNPVRKNIFNFGARDRFRHRQKTILDLFSAKIDFGVS